MEKIGIRNKKLRIVHDSLFVRIRGTDPVHIWDSEAEEYGYIRKQDWVRASPAIRTIEACVFLRITPPWFRVRRDQVGVVPKRTTMRKVPDVPFQGPQTYYTINDLVEISRALIQKDRHGCADEHEIRHLFSEGYVPYKKLRNGDFIPVWSESIY